MITVGYGFAYAAWIRSNSYHCAVASTGHHYFSAFEDLQRRTQP